MPVHGASSELIAKFLTSDQKYEISLQLAQKLGVSEEAPAVLQDLMGHLSSSQLSDITPYIEKYAEEAIATNHPDQRKHAIEFMRISPQIQDSVLEKVKDLLFAGAGAVHAFKTEHSGDHIAEETLLHAFEFLDAFLTACPELESSRLLYEIDHLLCLSLAHPDDVIAAKCSSTIRWRAPSLVKHSDENEEFAKHLWDVVFGLVAQNHKLWKANGYVLWLRLCSSGIQTWQNSQFIQNCVISLPNYWQAIQDGLISSSHEIRKYCLSILQLSVKSVNSSFDCGIFSWNTAKRDALLTEWSRFTTLYEILGIDTSLHQYQAATGDVLALLSVDSLIHASWGFTLLSTGFKATMDSVRKYSAHVLLSIERKNLKLLKHALPHLKDVFLPYMLQSQHFACRPKDGAVHSNFECEYGARITDFVANILYSLESHQDYVFVCTTIMEVLSSIRSTFDAVRIYTALGLVKGLDGQLVLTYDQHRDLLVTLFDNVSEGVLFQKAVQTLNLRLLACFQLPKLHLFVQTMSTFVSFNGYEVFLENSAYLKSYLEKCNFGQSAWVEYLNGDAPESEKIILLVLLLKETDWESSGISDTNAFALLEAGINVHPSVEKALGNMDLIRLISFSKVPLKQLVSDFSHEPLWSKVKKMFDSEQISELEDATACLRVVNNGLTKFGTEKLDFQEVLTLGASMFQNSAHLKSKPSYYKVKDEAIGEYHRLLSLYAEEAPAKQLWGQLQFETIEYVTADSICKIAQVIIPKEPSLLHSIVSGLWTLWQELVFARLRLTEKDLHCFIIRTVLHPVLLEASIEDEQLSDQLHQFCLSVVQQSFGRRGLLTQLTKSLSDFQVEQPAKFEQLSFVPEILARTACHRQNKTHAFRLESVVAQIYDEQLAPKESNIYKEVYGPEEVATRVWTFAMLNSITTEKFARAVFDSILNDEDPFRMVNIVKQTDGHEEYQRCQLAKVILSVIDKIGSADFRNAYFDRFNYFVEFDPSPLVRVYFEWIVAIHMVRDLELAEGYFERVAASLETHELKPTLVTILERILYLTISSLDKEKESEMLTRLLTIIVPAASTNKAITRHFSMSLATSVHEEVQRKNLQIDANLARMVEQMYKCALATDAFGQYRSGDAFLWDIVEDYDLVSVAGGILLRLSDREVDFVSSAEFHRYLSEKQKARLTRPVGEDRKNLWVSKIKARLNEQKQIQHPHSEQPQQSPLQTKSGAWSTVIDDNKQDGEVKRSELIVVASLVDKAPNLGGICRLCDVLGAGLMTIHDEKIKKMHQFKGVAVTADYWMPTLEVKPEMLVEYLKEKKRDGYTLIGLEQTDKSVELNDKVKFPKKSLIVLGKEREGVPGEVLAELDFCVEIKQVGVVRSMNIQTATAVIVHAYSAQHC